MIGILLLLTGDPLNMDFFCTYLEVESLMYIKKGNLKSFKVTLRYFNGYSRKTY